MIEIPPDELHWDEQHFLIYLIISAPPNRCSLTLGAFEDESDAKAFAGKSPSIYVIPTKVWRRNAHTERHEH